ncbi:MAG: hypothetical protein IKE75_03285 [Bacilli bacterium]|nr:hypothetical protein [Bacilli bacterium]
MKFFLKDNKIILYLNRFYFNNVDFNDKEGLNLYIKKLLQKLEDIYNLELKGFYTITMHIDKNYGVVMEIKGEDSLYLDYFSNTLDINLKVYEDNFLYDVSDVDISDDYDIYIYDNHIYVRFNKILSNIQMGRIMEKTNDILYGLQKEKVLKCCKVLR